MAGRKTGDTWLLITSKTRPAVLDQYVATADHALGNPSWLVGRIVTATGPIGFNFLDIVYGQLAVAAVIVALYQLRNVAVERRFPGHHLVRTFLVIGLLGPAIYMIFPVVGPIFAYGTGAEHWATVSLWSETPPSEHWAVADLWPETPPPINTPHHMPFDEITPRNCMPSLHTAWATAIFIHSRKGPRILRFAGTFWLIATLCATLGFGYHYGADLIAGVVFTLTIEAALRSLDRGWDRSGIQLVAYGATVFAALLVSYRYLPLEMAEAPVGVRTTSHAGDDLSGLRLRKDQRTVETEDRTSAATGTATRTSLSRVAPVCGLSATRVAADDVQVGHGSGDGVRPASLRPPASPLVPAVHGGPVCQEIGQVAQEIRDAGSAVAEDVRFDDREHGARVPGSAVHVCLQRRRGDIGSSIKIQDRDRAREAWMCDTHGKCPQGSDPARPSRR